jgi:hypothetical protein
LTARDRIPAAYPDRAAIAAGGLMNYGALGLEIPVVLRVFATELID